jgi:phosphate transport system permease protein
MSGPSDLIYKRRRITSLVALFLSGVAAIFALSFLVLIFWTLLERGLPSLNAELFTTMTSPPGAKGGLLNAIVGSFMMVGIATLIGAPVGILAGTFLSEYGTHSKVAGVIRFLNGVIVSAPSVIIGFFVYSIVVVRFKNFSGWAGILALSILIFPIVLSTTENMLRMVPDSLREAAAALGAPRWRIVLTVTYGAAKSGILTGVLLGVARISGETAPLLFTALNNQFWSTDLSRPMANLPVVIFQYAMSPYPDWQSTAWAGALLITFGVLFLNIIARWFLRKSQ